MNRDDRRELNSALGRAWELLKTAHFSLRACIQEPKCHGAAVERHAIQQWAWAVEAYTQALEGLLQHPPCRDPQTAREAVEGVRKRVIGRIISGKFPWMEEQS